MEQYNSKSKSGYFNDDTLEHFAEVAQKEGWEVMTREAFDFVKYDCDWEDEEDMHHVIKVLMSEVGFELTNQTRA